ncbi:MAG TPA: hypothetical protein VMQ62_10145 [Dongiaceae bacterium]|nr:hypothetical protein [Dongiaceae bacterium]
MALATPAVALTHRPNEGTNDERIIPAPWLDTLSEVEPEGGHGPAAPAAARFRGRHAGAWKMSFDRRTGSVSFIEGEGFPFAPGNGPAPRDLGEAAPRGLALMDAEGDLLKPAVGELRLNPERSAWLEDGRIVFLDYDWVVDDVPVEGGRVFLRINHGRVIQMGAARLGRGLPPAKPTVDAAEALDRLFAHAGGRGDDDVVLAAPTLVYLARARGESQVPWGGGITYRLAWRASFRRAGESMTWQGDVDAHTGEIVAFEDENRYAARVTGGVFPRSPNQAEVVQPFVNVRVFAGGATILTGDAGTFPYTSGPAFTALDGQYFRVTCTGCSNPERAFAFTDHGTGDLELGTGGLDLVGNGASTAAERNAFYHQTRVRTLARKWLSIGFLNNTTPTNLNLDDTCNAFWDGTATNFFRSGGGCSNTGTIADVMYHEWGHGLDQATNIGDGSTGEATGDVTSMSVVHDARIGPYFEVNGNPVRDLDSTRVGHVATPAALDANGCIICSGQCSNGPYGHEVHCEGEIYGQAHWDLAQAFIAKHGFNTGWQDLERIYFLSLPQADTMVPTSAQSVYNAYLAIDDDNGNLADGTPNCNEIDAAFRAHGIAPGLGCAGNTSPCARPAEPVVTITPAHGRVALDWSAVPNATQYVVLRADFSPTYAYLPLGTLTGTHFEDATVQPGVTYWYVVEARTAGGCRSTIENEQAASATPDARPFVDAIGVDDVPAGNRSGYADPGESIDLTLSLRNALPAGGVTGGNGTLSTTTPGVTLTNNSAAWGPMAPGATVDGSAFRAALANPGAVCGSTATFNLIWTDNGTGPATTATIPVLIGTRTTRYVEDFESDLVTPWPVSAGSPAATAGAWVIGDPGQTTWQPGGDATIGDGGHCLFTATNSAENTGDVDGGETIATSPTIDLSGASAARLTYKRWWASSSLTDAADTFIVEVSGNGGSTWVTAESVGGTARNLGWQPVEVRLETLVPLNANFKMRVKARDGAPDSNVEAAIDDIRIDEVTCDLTPPCFVPPTFAGAAAAAPGASCAETDLSWSPGSTSCQNAQVLYNVYRSTTPGFAPAPANRVATDLPGLAFHDTLLQPGATYYYVVRADDTRSGEESNAVQRTVAAPTAPDLAAPVFIGLSTAQSGAVCGAIALSWSGAAETCSLPLRYNVYRSTSSGFTPSPANRVATIFGTSYTDTALVPNQTYYYEVHAADAAGNEEGNGTERFTPARILPLVLYHEDFEGDPGGWATMAPNDALTGRFEWGDPQLTGAQPDDDATPAPGVSAWVTGLAAGSGIGANDVDTGTTTIQSPIIDISASPAPILEVQTFFNNDLGANPGEDTLRIDVSGNGGSTWVAGLVSFADFAPWTPVQMTLADKVPLNNQFRIRVQTSDLGVGGSLVEAGIDEVSIFQPNAGCSVCSGPVTGVGTIKATRSGDDVLLDWSADPVNAPGYAVYLRSGTNLGTAVRLGTTTTKSFVHAGGAAALGENFYYEVTAVDACGRESTLP